MSGRPASPTATLKIFQAPGYVVLLTEMIHEARIIPLDGRPHLPSSVRQWMGDSRGHWDGNTLVVETTNFMDRPNLFRFPASVNIQVIERLTRVDADHIDYRFTINDPTTWTAPWTAMVPMKLKDEMIFEYACHEGNDAIPDMLRGHRFEEREAASKTRSKQ